MTLRRAIMGRSTEIGIAPAGPLLKALLEPLLEPLRVRSRDSFLDSFLDRRRARVEGRRRGPAARADRTLGIGLRPIAVDSFDVPYAGGCRARHRGAGSASAGGAHRKRGGQRDEAKPAKHLSAPTAS